MSRSSSRALVGVCSLVLALAVAVSVPSVSLADDTAVAPAWAMPVGPDVVQGAADLELRQEQARNAALMPQAVDARRGTATRYADLSHTEAADVLQDTQPSTVSDLTYPKVNLEPGQDLKMVSPTKAEITSADGSTDLAVSTEPFGYPDANGDLKPLDLGLRNTDDGFSVTDSPVPTVLPDALDDPLAIGAGDQKVELVPHDAAAVSGVRRNTGIFYANIDTDTDLFVKPVVGGVETFHVLRSADSPESVAMDLDVADGTAAHLVDDPSNGGAVLETAGETVVKISAPKAVDADGKAVAVTMSLDGSTLSMHVAHRGADLTYPITVDPVYVDAYSGCWYYVANHQGCQIDLWETNYGDVYGNGGGAGWTYSESDTNGLINGWFSTNTAYLGMGLMISEAGYNHFETGQGGNWSLGAPGEVVIYNAGFYNVTTDNWDNDSCAFTGLRRNDGSWDNGVTYVGSCAQQTVDQAIPACWNGAAPTVCAPPANPASAMYGNRIWFGTITNQGPAWGWTHGFTHVMGGAIALMHDYIPPRVSIADPGGSGAVQVVLGDFGLGMKSWGIYDNGQPIDTWQDTNCSGGTSRFVCPHDHVGYVPRCGMHAGINVVAVTATDVSGNVVNYNVGANLDASLSGFSISGELPSVASAPLYQGSYGLHVDARDPCGVQAIAVRLDSATNLPTVYANSGDFTVDASQLAGTHTLHINAQNTKGQWMAEKTLNFTVSPIDDHPEFDADPPVFGDGELGIWDPSVGLTFDAIHAFAADRPVASSKTDVVRDASGALSTVPVSSADNPWLGISDQTHQSFEDPNLLGLKNIVRVRRIVAWDLVAWGALKSCGGYMAIPGSTTDPTCVRLRALDIWMDDNNGQANKRLVDGQFVEPLVSFEHGDTTIHPTPKDYANETIDPATYISHVKMFMDRYPNVKAFLPWNEPNNASQPFHGKPVEAGRLYGLLYDVCQDPARACQVIAGDFADGKTFGRAYMDGYKQGLGTYLPKVGVWGIHLHSSVQYRAQTSTHNAMQFGTDSWLKQFMAATSPQTRIWFTEVGAITQTGGIDHTAHADWVNISLQNIIRFAQARSRVTRVYYYQWRGSPSWDSGLVSRYPTDNTNVEGYGTPRSTIFPLFKLISDSDRLHPQLLQAPTGTVSTPSATVAFASAEAPDGYQCRLDTGAWADCVSPVTYDNLASGPHSVGVRSVMELGVGVPSDGEVIAIDRGYAGSDDEQDAASASWTVDTGPPDTSLQSAPSGPTSSTSASFVLTGTDDVAVTAFECQLDGASWSACATPQTYTGLAAGAHTFAVRAKDAAGNVDPSPATASWSVDVVAPGTSIVSSPSSPSAATTGVVAFSGSDDVAVASYECQLDGGAWAPCTSPKSYSSMASGSHTVLVRAIDTAGNLDATPATATWSVDATAPQTSITAQPAASTASGSASFSFAGSDDVAVASYECRLDAGAWAACSSPKAYSSLSAGTHTFAVRALDGVGNVDASPASASWTVDTTAPATTISDGPSGSTTATSTSLAFSGTDNVAVDSFECQLDAGAWATCSSPNAYSSLAVGTHTVKVRAKDAAGNVDASPAAASWTITGPAATVLLGSQTVESSNDEDAAHDVEAFPYTATADGSAASVSVYLAAGSTGAVSVGLYSAGGGRPVKLLASGTIASTTASAWNTVALDGRPVIANGTSYYLALQSANGGMRFRDRTNGPCTARGIAPGTSALPKQWPVQEVSTYSTCPASVYVTAGTADTSAPQTSITAQPAASTTATAASLTFAATDDYGVTATECRIDAGNWTACVSPRSYSGLAIGTHTVEIRSTDAAGNLEATPASATWAITTGAAPTQLAGNATVETHAEPITLGRGEAWPVTATATGTAGTISVYLDATATASDLQVALYSNNTNKPGTLLASGTASGQATADWATVALSGTASITSGTDYWLGVMSSDPTIVIRDRQSGTCTARAINTPLGAFPGTWTTDITTTTRCPASMTLNTN